MLRFALLWILVLAATAARAELIEEQIQVPITASAKYLSAKDQPIVVTVFRDDAVTTPRPFIIINHGRSPDGSPPNFRFRLSPYSKYLVNMGYVVFFPTRMGYGVSGGPDVEDPETCTRSPNLNVGMAAQVSTLEQTIKYVQKLPYVAADKGALFGMSYSGMAVVGIAAMNIPGIKAVVNIVGGAGGDGQRRPFTPCRKDLVADLFEQYGKTAKTPTMWVYSQNDRYWGDSIPNDWFKAFSSKAGTANHPFIWLPPYKDDGHKIAGAVNPWAKQVHAFLSKTGVQ